MQDSAIERKEEDSHRKTFGIIGAVFTGVRLLIGLTLLLIALVPPLMNKLMPDPAKIAGKSKIVAADSVDTSADGKFVSITGVLTSDETVGDALFNISGDYILLRRKVEMYSWIELESHSYRYEYSVSSRQSINREDVKDLSESSVEKTYTKDWSDESQVLYTIDCPEQFVNPRALIQSKRFMAGDSRLGDSRLGDPRLGDPRLGAYRVDLDALHFSNLTPVAINPATFAPAHDARVEGAHVIFAGEGSLLEPKVGDLRIQYDAIESGATVTLLGKLKGDAVEPYVHKGDISIYRTSVGSRKDALDIMQAEHRVNVFVEWALRAAPITKPPDIDGYRDPTSQIRRREVEEMAENREFVTAATWIFRGIGLFILWIGLCLFVGPIRKKMNSARAMDTTRRPRLVLPMLAVAIALSAVLWWL